MTHMKIFYHELPPLQDTQSQEERDAERQKHEARRQAHNDYLKTYVQCDCGGRYMRTNKGMHMKTEKHKTLLQLRTENNKVKAEIKKEILKSFFEHLKRI